MPRFRSIARESDLATPILIQACLPEGHLARYIVEIVESLDLSAIEQRYAGRGHEAYPPSLLLALLIYAFDEIFVPVLRVARENGMSRFGRVSLEGTKIHANASRHRALSYAHAEPLEAKLKAEVAE